MPSIRQYISEFQRQMKLRNLRPSTQDTYSSIMLAALCHFQKDPRAISQRMWEDYLLGMKSTRTKRQCIYTARHFYASVLQMSEHLSGIPIPKQEKFVPEILNAQEVYRLVQCIRNLKQRACIQLIYACALRIGEVVCIRVADIDGPRQQLHIRHAKGAQDRIVPIPAETLQLLRTYFAQYRPSEYLFGGQNSAQYDVRSIQQVFHRSCRAAGIRKRVTVHSLRHSRATHLVDNGIDMSMVQKFLGHKRITTTIDFYLHTSIQTMQNLFAVADQRISGAVPVALLLQQKLPA